MPSADLIVDLYQQTFKLPKLDVCIKRVLSPDSDQVLDFIGTNFSSRWVSEAKAGLFKPQPTCFVAVDEQKIIGFACYDATAKGFFGPMGVHPNYRKHGIGSSLLIKCLEAMFHDGYGYTIIGSVSEQTQHFYHQVCGATPIENSTKLYHRLIDR